MLNNHKYCTVTKSTRVIWLLCIALKYNINVTEAESFSYYGYCAIFVSTELINYYILSYFH